MLIQNSIAAVFLAAMLICCTGCPSSQTAPETPRPSVMPTYAELAGKHNDRISDIDRLWARSVIEVRWKDEQGGNRLEQGEGHVILEPPNKSAMTIGKVGVTKLWAGSNDTHLWLFDELDGKKVYIGRHDGKTDALPPNAIERPAPFPVRPVDLARLLGILPLPPAPADPKRVPPVEWREGRYVVEPADQALRYYFNIHYRIDRVERLDHLNRPIIVARMTGETQRMEIENKAVGPYISTRIEVTTPGKDGSMVLHLYDATNAPRKFDPDIFDLDSRIKTLKPEQTIYIRQ